MYQPPKMSGAGGWLERRTIKKMINSIIKQKRQLQKYPSGTVCNCRQIFRIKKYSLSSVGIFLFSQPVARLLFSALQGLTSVLLLIVSILFGSPNWARTSDIMINSHALYRVSVNRFLENGLNKPLISENCFHYNYFVTLGDY